MRTLPRHRHQQQQHRAHQGALYTCGIFPLSYNQRACLPPPCGDGRGGGGGGGASPQPWWWWFLQIKV